MIDGGIDARVLLQPDRVLARQDQRLEVRKTVTGTSFTEPEFSGGQPRKMELALLFDQTFPPYTMTVRAATAALLDAMEVPSGTTGGTPTAVAAVHHVPLGRADLQGRVHVADLHLQAVPARRRAAARRRQADAQAGGEPPVKGQNPTTRAQAGFGMHTVKDGDTLPSISYRAYGDATRWRLIAEANGVDNPLHLRRGSSLSLPTLET